MKNLKKVVLGVMLAIAISVMASSSAFAGPILPPNTIVTSK